MKDQYIVMAGCEYPAKPSFTENGIHDNLIDAESDAESRNLYETANGNHGVLWFVNVNTVAMQKMMQALQ